MKSTDRLFPRGFGLAIVFALTLMFSSCLELQANLRLAKDGVVSADLTYVFDENSAGFGRGFGSDEPWPLPLTEKDFRQQQLRVTGVKLESYKTKTLSDGRETIEVSLKSESLDVLADYLGLDFRLEGTSRDGSFILRTPDMTDYMAASESTREVFERITEGMVFRFRFRPPSRPTESLNGTIDRRYASFDITMRQILNGEAPNTWSVSW